MIKMDVGTPGGIVSQISPAPHLTSEGEYWFRELFTPSQNLSVKGKETDLVGRRNATLNETDFRSSSL
ncbi:hypothetical protein [Candidatus Darwinibacter acetoxidans]